MPNAPGTTLEDATCVGEVDVQSHEPVSPPSNLANLLDRFTSAVTNPEAETVGGFAATIDALHAELAMLARHFGADAGAVGEAIDLDDGFPDTELTTGHTDYTGIAGAEELEHLCRELSRT